MNAVGDILALAAMYAEVIGCTREVALQDMEFRQMAVQDGRGDVPLWLLPRLPPEHPIPLRDEPEPVVPPALLVAPPVLVQAPLPLELEPFNNRRFAQAVRDARPGCEYSPGDLAYELGMELPKAGSKRPAHLMKAAGWVFAGYRSLTTNRGQVYRKPLPHEVQQ